MSILVIFSGYRLQTILSILDGILLLTLIFCLFFGCYVVDYGGATHILF